MSHLQYTPLLVALVRKDERVDAILLCGDITQCFDNTPFYFYLSGQMKAKVQVEEVIQCRASSRAN
jgi:Icc-related predicted phosphoesterase